ncbi:MAG: thiol peroxidase [Deltaproteobacteria bacterium]|nr:thiol peroxidase [Deltaproteobacteria bacterium]
MAQITLHGTPIQTIGSLPALKSKAPDFQLTKADLSDTGLKDFHGQRLVLNIFPSIDTGVCATAVRRFNAEAEKLENTAILCISADLPFAQARFCGAEGLDRVITLSAMRDRRFGEDYGVTIVDGPLAGLFSRAVVIVDENGIVTYSEQVPEIAQEPDYEAALKNLR